MEKEKMFQTTNQLGFLSSWNSHDIIEANQPRKMEDVCCDHGAIVRGLQGCYMFFSYAVPKSTVSKEKHANAMPIS
jgi:hypothetical protein